MFNLILIVFCVVAGYAIKAAGLVPAGGHKGLNAWILYIALPACFLRYMPTVQWNKETMLPVLAPVLVWAGCWLFVSLYAGIKDTDKASRGALKLSAGLSNTAFLGFITVFYSEAEIKTAVLYDQSSFILLSTTGLITALRASGQQKPAFAIVLKKLLSFPPLLACILGLLLPAMDVDLPVINPLLDRVVATLGPMALFAIGLQLDFSAIQKEKLLLIVGLCYKLLVAPLLILSLVLLLGLKGNIARITVFEAAMPTLAMAAVLADEYRLNASLASLVVGISMLLSFVTMGLWWWVLSMIV